MGQLDEEDLQTETSSGTGSSSPDVSPPHLVLLVLRDASDQRPKESLTCPEIPTDCHINASVKRVHPDSPAGNPPQAGLQTAMKHSSARLL